MQLASLLSSELGVALPSTVAFDYPTVEAIARFVLDLPSEVLLHTSARIMSWHAGTLRAMTACLSDAVLM